MVGHPAEGTADNTPGEDMFAMELYYDTVPWDSEWPTYKNGNIAAQRVAFSTTDTVHYLYEYDEIDRLSRADRTGMSLDSIGEYEKYGYDKNGNRSWYWRWGSSDTVFTVLASGTNQIDSLEKNGVSQNRYSYDANGNLTWDSVKAVNFYYDHFSQMNSVESLAGDDST
jgi:hypothetical protein